MVNHPVHQLRLGRVLQQDRSPLPGADRPAELQVSGPAARQDERHRSRPPQRIEVRLEPGLRYRMVQASGRTAASAPGPHPSGGPHGHHPAQGQRPATRNRYRPAGSGSRSGRRPPVPAPRTPAAGACSATNWPRIRRWTAAARRSTGENLRRRRSRWYGARSWDRRAGRSQVPTVTRGRPGRCSSRSVGRMTCRSTGSSGSRRTTERQTLPRRRRAHRHGTGQRHPRRTAADAMVGGVSGRALRRRRRLTRRTATAPALPMPERQGRTERDAGHAASPGTSA